MKILASATLLPSIHYFLQRLEIIRAGEELSLDFSLHIKDIQTKRYQGKIGRVFYPRSKTLNGQDAFQDNIVIPCIQS